MKVLHILSSNRYSGAENVVCQIIDMFRGEIEMAYCSPDGDIANSLKERNVKFFPLKKLNRKELMRVVKEYQPDIIHGHDLKAVVNVSLLPNKYEKVAHIHVNDKKRLGKLSLKSVALITIPLTFISSIMHNQKTQNLLFLIKFHIFLQINLNIFAFLHSKTTLLLFFLNHLFFCKLS